MTTEILQINQPLLDDQDFGNHGHHTRASSFCRGAMSSIIRTPQQHGEQNFESTRKAAKLETKIGLGRKNELNTESGFVNNQIHREACMSCMSTR